MSWLSIHPFGPAAQKGTCFDIQLAMYYCNRQLMRLTEKLATFRDPESYSDFLLEEPD